MKAVVIPNPDTDLDREIWFKKTVDVNPDSFEVLDSWQSSEWEITLYRADNNNFIVKIVDPDGSVDDALFASDKVYDAAEFFRMIQDDATMLILVLGQYFAEVYGPNHKTTLAVNAAGMMGIVLDKLRDSSNELNAAIQAARRHAEAVGLEPFVREKLDFEGITDEKVRERMLDEVANMSVDEYFEAVEDNSRWTPGCVCEVCNEKRIQAAAKPN